MAKYIMNATEIVNYEVIVEADNEQSAYEIAEAMIDGWHQTGGEFTVDYATLIED